MAVAVLLHVKRPRTSQAASALHGEEIELTAASR
jgi:hypothetical protein